MSSTFKTILKYIIAAIILYLLYRSGLMQFKKVSEILFQPKIFFFGLLLFTLQVMTFSLRWKLISSIKKQISFGSSFKQYLIGQFFNTFVPGGVGGDVVKAFRLSSETGLPRSDSLSLTLLDRVFGIFGLVLFSFIFLLLEYKYLDNTTVSYFYISSFILLIALLCLYFRKNIQKLFLTYANKLQNKFILKIRDLFGFFFDNLNQIFIQKKVIWFLSISFIAQLLSIFFIYYVVSQLSPTSPSFLLFFPLVTFGFIAMTIPLTPGSIGVGQMAFYLIFKTIDEHTAQSAIIAISLMQFFNLILSLPGGYYFFKGSHTAEK